MHDLIFVSLENWDEIWRRNQFLCAELSERHPDMHILFVALPRNVSHGIRHGRFDELLRTATYSPPGFPDITVTHPLKLFPDSLPMGQAANELMFRRHVRAVANSLRMRDPVLWLNPQSAVHMVGCMDESIVVYDITDDWTTFTQSPRLRRRIVRQDSRLCRQADQVIVCSQRLYELKQSLVPAARLHLIPNGVHVEHYRKVLDRSAPMTSIARAWPRPVMGYTGTIHPDRIDTELVRRLALAPGIRSVVLVGPNHLRAAEMELLQLPNVFMPGPVPYARIPEVMRAFDVCIVPHRVTPFTESLNPLKLWEYLAGGKPIVSTAVAGFREYPHLVSIAQTPEQFIAASLEALHEERGLADARRAEARKHSWQNRVDLIEQVLSGNANPIPEAVHAG